MSTDGKEVAEVNERNNSQTNWISLTFGAFFGFATAIVAHDSMEPVRQRAEQRIRYAMRPESVPPSPVARSVENMP